MAVEQHRANWNAVAAHDGEETSEGGIERHVTASVEVGVDAEDRVRNSHHSSPIIAIARRYRAVSGLERWRAPTPARKLGAP